MTWTEEQYQEYKKAYPDSNLVKEVERLRAKNPNTSIADMQAPKPSKYRNQRTPYNGRVYDTKGEAQKAAELDLKVKAGEIDYWLYHVRFPLPGNCVYESDFMTFKYDTNVLAWDIEVIEKKMWRKASKNHKEGFFYTEAAKIKMRLFTETYPLFKLIVEK